MLGRFKTDGLCHFARFGSQLVTFGSLASNKLVSNVASQEGHQALEEIIGRKKDILISSGERKKDRVRVVYKYEDIEHPFGIMSSCEDIGSLLERFGNAKDLEKGEKVNVHMVYHGLESSILLGNLLISMYVKCGTLANATRWFHKMHSRDVFTWTLLIGAYSKSGHSKQAWNVFWSMVHDDVKPNNVTFLSILKACTSLTHVKVIHALMVNGGIDCDDFIRSALVDMYAKCGSIHDAHALFEKLQKHHIVAWNTMIAAYAQHELHDRAFYLFWQMQSQNVEPDEVTCLNVLKACINQGCSKEGRRVHMTIIQSKMESDTFLANTLIDMYAKDMSMADAIYVFNHLSARDVVSWSVIIAAYVLHGQAHEAWYHFEQMQLSNFKPNKVTYMSVLKACARLSSLREGHNIHIDIILNHWDPDIFLGSSLIDMYCKCGRIEDAIYIFMSMAQQDVIAWNSIIDGFSEMGENKEALNFFWKMQGDEVTPDEITFVCTLKACTNLGDLEQGRWIHSHAIEFNMFSQVQVGNTLLDMYAKCGCMIDARHVFDKMHERPMFVWTSAICGYIQNELGNEGLQLFDQMKQEGLAHTEVTFSTISKACGNTLDLEHAKQIHVPIIELSLDSDVHVGNSLLDMYSKCGSFNHATQVFDNMLQKDVVTYNTVISGYVHNGVWDKAIHTFWQMEMSGVKADTISFTCVLKACGGLAGLEHGMLIHILVVEDSYDRDDILKGIFVDMYAKCGSIIHAKRTFDDITRPDAITWTTILSGYAQHGCGEEAFQLLGKMLKDNVSWDEITLVGVISACSNAGLVQEGLHCFYLMNKLCGISWNTQHYACVFDLLGRAGCLDYTAELANLIPSQPATIVWSTLLAACKLHEHVGMAHYSVKHVFELEPTDITASIMLSNIKTAYGMQPSNTH